MTVKSQKKAVKMQKLYQKQRVKNKIRQYNCKNYAKNECEKEKNKAVKTQKLYQNKG